MVKTYFKEDHFKVGRSSSPPIKPRLSGTTFAEIRFILMRQALLIFLLLATNASAQASENDATLSGRDYSRLMDKANQDFLRELANRIKEAGYADVQIVPQLFVVIAKKTNGSPKMLIVDYNTMRAIEVENGLEFGGGAKNSAPETDIPQLH
jgi:hypothetical protein